MTASPLRAELRRDFFVRQGCVGAMIVFFSGVMILLGLKSWQWPMIASGFGFLAIWAVLIGWTHLETIREMTADAAIRRDGKRLPWSEFEREVEGYYYLKSGTKVLNHIDLTFKHGRVRLYPLTLTNCGVLLDFARARTRAAADSSSGTNLVAAPAPVPRVLVEAETARKAIEACSICSQLRDQEYAMQKAGQESDNSYLPAAAGRLVNLGELQPGRTRSPELNQCPECGRYYWYKVDYEFLVYGSEDEQRLVRLSDAEGEALHTQIRAAKDASNQG